jgi:hypothetical protein
VIYTTSRSSVFYANFPMVTSNVDNDHGYIQALYHHILRRTGSPGEINQWVGLLQSQGRLAVVSALEHSPEARARLVEGWFLRFLGRPAGPGETQPYVSMLLAGASEEVVLGTLLGSPGYFRTAEFRASEVQYDYAHLLGRAPSLAERNGWVFSSLDILGIRMLIETGDEFYFFGV